MGSGLNSANVKSLNACAVIAQFFFTWDSSPIKYRFAYNWPNLISHNWNLKIIRQFHLLAKSQRLGVRRWRTDLMPTFHCVNCQSIRQTSDHRPTAITLRTRYFRENSITLLEFAKKPVDMECPLSGFDYIYIQTNRLLSHCYQFIIVYSMHYALEGIILKNKQKHRTPNAQIHNHVAWYVPDAQ